MIDYTIIFHFYLTIIRPYNYLFTIDVTDQIRLLNPLSPLHRNPVTKHHSAHSNSNASRTKKNVTPFRYRSRFCLLKEHLVEFNQLAMANAEGSDNMLNRVMPKDNIGLAALLRTKEAAWDNGESLFKRAMFRGERAEFRRSLRLLTQLHETLLLRLFSQA